MMWRLISREVDHVAESDPGARESLREIITGFRLTHLVITAAELGIADHLVDGPRTSAELAPLIGANSDALYRVMRALAALGVLTLLDGGRFGLGPLGQHLRSDIPGSLRPLARFWNLEANRRPWQELLHSTMTGECAFEHHFGMEKFAYVDARPDIAAIYNAGMASISGHIGQTIVEAYEFGSFGTIVDVGGGNGSLLAAILQHYSAPRGVVFDLPHAEPSARVYLEGEGLADRCDFVGGSFFEAVPTGADAYVMRLILHDWDDSASTAILKTCRRAMSPDSKLLVVERLLPDGIALNFEAFMADINMLVQFGGRERTTDEFAALFKSADLCLARVIPTGTIFQIVEAIPA
jgi:hypothetical protein